MFLRIGFNGDLRLFFIISFNFMCKSFSIFSDKMNFPFLILNEKLMIYLFTMKKKKLKTLIQYRNKFKRFVDETIKKIYIFITQSAMG